MITVRRAAERGHARHGWLDSRHSFSFAEYHDPAQMGFGALRVINEDRVDGGAGFPTHGHRDMEIVSYVLDGALEHRDSTGTGAVIRPGDVQRMSAGTGIRHSEYNHSPDDNVHFLQIWIIPERTGLKPGYEQRSFADRLTPGSLTLVGARDGAGGAVTIHQDVALWVAKPADGRPLDLTLAAGRRAWVQIARGAVEVNGTPLAAGDGAAIADARALRLAGDGEALVFDLA